MLCENFKEKKFKNSIRRELPEIAMLPKKTLFGSLGVKYNIERTYDHITSSFNKPKNMSSVRPSSKPYQLNEFKNESNLLEYSNVSK